MRFLVMLQIQEALGAGQEVFELLDREPIMTGQAKTEEQQSMEHSSSSTLPQRDSTVVRLVEVEEN